MLVRDGQQFKSKTKLIDKRERILQAFAAFLSDFIYHLNQRSNEGWAIMVEGARDERALRRLGYVGGLATISSFVRRGPRAFNGSRVVVLTDLDREGATLASRFARKLSHEGLEASLVERRRLKAASRGVFLHIENLSRFADSVERMNRKQEFILSQILPESKLS